MDTANAVESLVDIPVAPALTRNCFEVVLEALQSVPVPEQKSRRNVRQTPDQLLHGMVIGAVACRTTGAVRTSKQMRERPMLTKLLVQFATQSVDKDFAFSSIQVNKNYASALHCDLNNKGPSYIVGLGHYTGGALWTEEVALHWPA